MNLKSASTQRASWLFAITASVVCVGARAQTPIADWHVNETSWSGSANEVIDSSASAAHGTARNGASAVDFSGRFANAAGCSSTSNPPCQHVDFGNRNLNLDAGNVVTVMAWVRWSTSPQQGSPWANILSNQSNTQMDVGQFWLQHSGTSSPSGTRNEFFEWAVQARTGGGGGGRVYVYSQTRPTAGAWYHVAGVYDGSSGNRVIRIYVNGVLEGTTPLQNNIAANTSALRLQMGQWAFNQGGSIGNRAFNGDIDEGRIFRAALTQAQIQAQMRIFGTRRPRAVDDTITVTSSSLDNVVNVLANDSSEPPPGTTVAVLNVGAAGFGTATLVGGVVHYRPPTGFSGPDSFVYTMIDSLGATASAVVHVDILDDTPPETSIVSGPPPLDSSSTAAFNFAANEPATFQCSLDGAFFASCADPSSFAGLVDGPHTLLVRAVDGAGNIDPTPAAHSWTIDATPPSVTSFAYSLLPHPYSEAGFVDYISGGVTVRATVRCSEPLSAAELRFTSGATVLSFPGTVASADGSWDFSLDATPPPGTYAASVWVVDVIGNAQVVPVTLAAPGFVSVSVIETPCMLLNEDSTPACSDFDGDGSPGSSAACTDDFGDCDDTNPTVHLYAPEIPGDGVDNGCFGGADWPVDETTGVFVSPSGSAAGNGSRAAPLASLRDALALAASTGRVVFAAQGSYTDGGAPLTIGVSLFGAFDGSWERTPLTQSTVSITAPAVIAADVVVGIELDLSGGGSIGVSGAPLTTLIDSRVVGSSAQSVTLDGRNRMVRTDVVGPVLTLASGTLVAIHGNYDALVQQPNTALQLARCVVGPITAGNGSLASFRTLHDGPIVATGTSIRASTSTFRAAGAAITLTGGVLIAANTLLNGAATGIAHDAATITWLRNNLFDASCPLTNAGTCVPSTCGSGGNLCGGASFTGAGDYHLQSGSPGVNAGMRRHPDLIGTTTVVDIDGSCVVGEQDIGADEVR